MTELIKMLKRGLFFVLIVLLALSGCSTTHLVTPQAPDDPVMNVVTVVGMAGGGSHPQRHRDRNRVGRGPRSVKAGVAGAAMLMLLALALALLIGRR